MYEIILNWCCNLQVNFVSLADCFVLSTQINVPALAIADGRTHHIYLTAAFTLCLTLCLRPLLWLRISRKLIFPLLSNQFKGYENTIKMFCKRRNDLKSTDFTCRNAQNEYLPFSNMHFSLKMNINFNQIHSSHTQCIYITF